MRDLATKSRRLSSGRLIALLAAAAAAGGCAIAKVEKEIVEAVELGVAPASLAEERLLDVGIVEFDPNLNPDKNEDFVYPDIRRAEARYIPYHLKSTLERAGHWGAIRVLPSASAHVDLTVSGTILESDGESAKVRFAANDATGKRWFSKSYKTKTGRNSYSSRRDFADDPYQNVYNEFANDLATYAAQVSQEEIDNIRRMTELNFMADLAPRVFGDYVVEDDKGIRAVQRLPAESDPMVARLRRVRERDQLFIDTLNEHYANFYYGIAIPYEDWRRAAREEVLSYKEIRRSALIKQIAGVVTVAAALNADVDNSADAGGRAQRALRNMVVYSGLEAVRSGFTLRASANLHKESIAELADSFGAEAADMVVQVRGQTRRLSGTAESQYGQWRKLLQEIYEAETGFTEEAVIGVPERAPQPSS
ncbi:MAG: hypothetical protein AAFZ58_14050 [Pseudomonadota bacterium]